MFVRKHLGLQPQILITATAQQKSNCSTFIFVLQMNLSVFTFLVNERMPLVKSIYIFCLIQKQTIPEDSPPSPPQLIFKLLN